MKYRTLGGTRLRVSEIGFGAWGIGGVVDGSASYGHTSDDESKKAIEKAVELGINFFDTAPAYGNGKSERLLGEVLSSMRSSVVIATKVGIERFVDGHNFSSNALRDSVGRSLERLKTDYLDLVQFHSPNLDSFKAQEAVDVLVSLRKKGVIRHIGASVKSPGDIDTLLPLGDIASYQVNLNILDQRILKPHVLSALTKSNVGLIARTPLCFGFLTEDMQDNVVFDANDHRSQWSREQIALWLKGRDMIRDNVSIAHEESVEMTALRFCLSFKEVSVVIPGILNNAQAESNAKASDRGPLGQDHVEYLTRLYATNKFFI